MNSKLRSRAPKGARDPQQKIALALQRALHLADHDIADCVEACANAQAFAIAAKNSNLIAATQAIAGHCARLYGNREVAVEHFKKGLIRYKQLGDLDAVLELRGELATVKLTAGNEKQTLEELHQIVSERTQTSYSMPTSRIDASSRQPFFLPRTWQERLSERIPKPSEIERNQRAHLAALYDSIGIGYIVLREHHKAASFLEEEFSIATLLNDRTAVARALNNLGYVHALLGNNVLALEYCRQGLKLARQLRDKRSLAITQRNLAQLYLTTGPATKGKRFAEQSFATASEIGMHALACRPLVLLTKYERLHGSLAKATALNHKALKLLCDEPESGSFIFFSIQQLLIEHATSPSKSVYRHLLGLHAAAKSRGLELQHEIAQEIARVTEELHLLPEAIRWFRRVQEYEIERLNTEQRSALVSLQTEQQLAHLGRERELQQLQLEKLEIRLNAKARETELLAVHLAKKSSVLASLTSELDAMKRSKSDYSNQTIDAILGLIETIRFKDKDYEQLESRASELHREFALALDTRYPDLTATEKRICILLKLGLSSVDVANVLFTSVRTIETHALSIRKKLRLPTTTRLAKFLTAFV